MARFKDKGSEERLLDICDGASGGPYSEGGGNGKSGAGRSFGLEDQNHVEGEGGRECSLLVSPLHTVWIAGEGRSESAECRCLKSSAASKGIPSEPESTGRQEAMAGGQVYQVEGPGSPFGSRKMHSRVMGMEF